jgi:hypothetical protein
MPIKHAYIHAGTDDGDPDSVSPSDWNASHTLETSPVTLTGTVKVLVIDPVTGEDIAHTTAQAIANLAIETDLGTSIAAATAKTTPVDADSFGLSDSAASDALKKLTWANVKATLKTYLDTLYVALTGAQTIAGVKTFSSLPIVPNNPTADGEVVNKYTLAAAIATVTGNQPVFNALVSGGQVIWESALTFRVSAAVYYIGGVLYSSAEQTITLDAADA